MKILAISFILSLVVAATGLGYAQHAQPQAPSLTEVLTEDGLNVKVRLDTLHTDIARIRRIAGWELRDIQIINNNALFVLENDGGFIATLRPWADKHGYTLTINGNKATLRSGLRQHPPLPTPQKLSILDVTAQISESLNYIHQTAQIRFDQDISIRDYKRRDTTFMFNALPYNDLVNIGSSMDNLPVSFASGELSINAAGQLAGELTLSIYGV